VQNHSKICQIPPCAKRQSWSIIEIVLPELIGGRSLVAGRNRSGQKFGDPIVFGMFNNHAQQDNQAQYSLLNVAHRFVGVYGHGYIEI
jgi:hypothetical protein